MLDDIRNHDPLPSDEEQRWIGFDDLGALARALLLAVSALAIGVGAATVLDGPNVTLSTLSSR